MRALIVIDVQKDFLPDGALPVPDGDAVIDVINRLQPEFELIVATRDWHPPDHGSFAANHPGHAIGETIELDGEPQILWPVHCVQYSDGASFADGLQVHRFTRVFFKGTDPKVDSYSGFFDNAHRRATGLDAFLRSHKVTDVYLTGLATDYCVKYTALDARQLGYNAHLIVDACRGVNLKTGDVDRAIKEMRDAGVRIE